jgi:hypothetical protein
MISLPIEVGCASQLLITSAARTVLVFTVVPFWGLIDLLSSLPASFLRLFSTNTDLEKSVTYGSVIYGRNGGIFVKEKKANFHVGLN